jgi:hypothetical protein
MSILRRLAFCMMCCFASESRMIGDAVTFVSHEVLNGKVMYGQSFACLTARFKPNIRRVYQIPKTAIEKIEFTETDFNPGPPATGLTSFPSTSEQGNVCVASRSRFDGEKEHFENGPSDSLALRDGSVVTGELIRITDKTVIVSTRRKPLKRKDVHTIRFR